MPGQSLSEVVTELYAELPDAFTAARNEHAKSIAADDRELAAEIRKLRRPSPAAWLVNQLVRQRGEQVDSIIDLGAELRDAGDDLDADTLAQFTRQRRRLVTALARDAGELAESLGNPVRSPVLDEVAQTMQAAMTDASAADAVRTGRLIRSLEAVGREVDLDGAVAGEIDGALPTSRGTAPRGAGSDGASGRGAKPSRGGGGGSRGRDGSEGGGERDSKAEARARAAEQAREEKTRREERERAERAAEESASRAEAAEQALDELEERIAALRRLIDERAEQRDDLEQRLREVEIELADAERELRPLGREHDRAARSAREARAAAEEARAALD